MKARSTWVVSVHYSGGSTAEEVEPQVAFRVGDENGARALSEAINTQIDRVNVKAGFDRLEYWATYFEAVKPVELTPQAAGLVGVTVPPDHVAVDIDATFKKLLAVLDGEGTAGRIFDQPIQEFVDADFEMTRQRLLEELGP